jgi:hypothetical protein
MGSMEARVGHGFGADVKAHGFLYPRETPIAMDRTGRDAPNFDRTGICQDNSSTDVFAT